MTDVIDFERRRFHDGAATSAFSLTQRRGNPMKRFLLLFVVAGVLLAACSAGATAVPLPTDAPAPPTQASAPTVMPDVPFKPYPAELPPVTADKVKHITLEIKDVNLEVAPGVVMKAWTFGGT